MGIGLFLLFLVNLFISWHNAKVIGRIWTDSEKEGGFSRLLAWSGGIMSGVGFTWCYGVLVFTIGGATGLMSQAYLEIVTEMWMVPVLILAVGSGLVIWVENLVSFWRERSFGEGARFAWNTYAQISNTYHAAESLPRMFKHLGSFFEGESDSKGKLVLLAVLIMLAGFFTTFFIARKAARERLNYVLSMAGGETK